MEKVRILEQSQKHLKYYRKNIFYEKCQRKRRGDRAILEKADSATGYEIRYSTDSKMKKNVQKKVITRNKNTTLKIKKLKIMRCIMCRYEHISWQMAKRFTVHGVRLARSDYKRNGWQLTVFLTDKLQYMHTIFFLHFTGSNKIF